MIVNNCCDYLPYWVIMPRLQYEILRKAINVRCKKCICYISKDFRGDRCNLYTFLHNVFHADDNHDTYISTFYAIAYYYGDATIVELCISALLDDNIKFIQNWDINSKFDFIRKLSPYDSRTSNMFKLLFELGCNFGLSRDCLFTNKKLITKYEDYKHLTKYSLYNGTARLDGYHTYFECTYKNNTDFINIRRIYVNIVEMKS